jgi:predicted transcriptional regulator of viral defense system
VNAVEALARLRALGLPFVTTSDAAAVFRQSTAATSMTLRRLAKRGALVPIRSGLWSVNPQVDPYLLPEYLTAPFPSYISFQSALHLRGMVEQIPSVIYAATLGRTQRIKTSFGTYSFHHLAPELFDGFETLESGVKLATPEKALFDVFYLSATKTRLFAALPELELPENFRRKQTTALMGRIRSKRLRAIVNRHMEAVLRGR